MPVMDPWTEFPSLLSPIAAGSLLSLLGLLDAIDHCELRADRATFALLNGCMIAFALFLTALATVLSFFEETDCESEPDKDWSEATDMMKINAHRNDESLVFYTLK
jgi:hypothetical protein